MKLDSVTQLSLCDEPKCYLYRLAVNINHKHDIKDQECSKSSSEGNNSYRVPIPRRYDLIPPLVLDALAEIYEEGAVKYGDAKYIEKPLPFSVIVNHLMNHLSLFCKGDRTEKHLAKIMWGAAAMMTLEELASAGFIESQNDLSTFGSRVQDLLQKKQDLDLDYRTKGLEC